MISPRKGKIIISKELYDSTEINDALFKLEMKVYKVDYMPFQDWYEIYFTSKYLDEIPDSQEPALITIEITRYGFSFKKVKHD